MFFEPHFTPDPNAWPPTASTGGILGLAFPDYIRGIDLNNKEAWSVDEWRAYARYLEEYGKTIIDRLEQKLKETEVELTIQRELASRRKESKGFKEIMKQPQSAWLMREMMRQSQTARGPNPGRFIEQREPGESPLMAGILSFFHKPAKTEKRGRKKDSNSKPLMYAQRALQKRSSNGEFKSDWEALESVYDDLKLSRQKKERPSKAQSRNTLNLISKLRNHNISIR